MFALQDTRGRVQVAFTDRHGPRGGPFASLDLGEPRGASPEVRAAARNAIGTVALDLGVPRVVRMSQVHGSDVAVVDGSSLDAVAETPPAVDGLVTALPEVALLVRVADCVPVLLADPVRGVVGAAHAGRAGMVAGIVPRTVAAMRELGAEDVMAWVGPHVCGGCYEVPELMRAEVAARVPEAYAETVWGTPALDVGAGVRAQLAAVGTEVVDASRCTYEDEDLYSYRRQGFEAGRLGGLVWVRG